MIRRFRPKFHQTLLLAFVSLLIVAMVVSGFAVSVTSTQRVQSSMSDNLAAGLRVVRSFLANREAQLAASVQVVARDFAFVTAVATQDTATIGSVLVNHGSRIGADLFVLTDLEGVPLSASDPQLSAAPVIPFRETLAQAQRTGESAGLSAWNGEIFQLFIVPVKAPNVIAWVALAFKLDEHMARDVSVLTGLEVTFAEVVDGRIRTLASSLHADARTTLDWLPPELQFDQSAPFEDAQGRFLGLATSLVNSPANAAARGGHIAAVVQVPTELIAKTQRELIGQLGAILAVTLCLCLGVSVWLARRLSNPVARLIDAARRIRNGDYQTTVQVDQGGEMALLGQALNTMVEGIAAREEKIRDQAYTDPVTRLPNRTQFLEWLRGELQAAEQGAPVPEFTLGLLALNNLRDVNYSLGAACGDQLRVAAARRLTEGLRCGAVYAFSPDEFALVMPGRSPREGLATLKSLSAVLDDTYEFSDLTVSTRVTGAVIGFPCDASDPQALMRGADSTLDRARAGNARVLVYLPGHEEERQRQLQIAGDFERAFAEDHFHLCYQPKIELATGQALECEALLRWVHPELGFIPPDEFILLAERSGNIRALTDWVLDQAIGQAAHWHRAGMPVRVAVNLSAHDVADASLVRVVRDLMHKHSACGDLFTLEITESAVMRDRERATEILVALKRLGIRLSIDDFGTGYSSLAQLKQLPVDELKIDKSFVLKLDESPGDALIVRSTIELAHNLGLMVVAEGLENLRSLELLRQFGCDKVQGYYFAKPLTKDDFRPWWTTFNSQDGSEIQRRA